MQLKSKAPAWVFNIDEHQYWVPMNPHPWDDDMQVYARYLSTSVKLPHNFYEGFKKGRIRTNCVECRKMHEARMRYRKEILLKENAA